jgi:hypothetical protein
VSSLMEEMAARVLSGERGYFVVDMGLLKFV